MKQISKAVFGGFKSGIDELFIFIDKNDGKILESLTGHLTVCQGIYSTICTSNLCIYLYLFTVFVIFCRILEGVNVLYHIRLPHIIFSLYVFVFLSLLALT